MTDLQTEKTAQAWVMNGFTPEEVWRYLEARCPIPSKAAELRDNGITPDKAAQHYGFDEDDFPMTLGEAYCAGEMEDVPQDFYRIPQSDLKGWGSVNIGLKSNEPKLLKRHQI